MQPALLRGRWRRANSSPSSERHLGPVTPALLQLTPSGTVDTTLGGTQVFFDDIGGADDLQLHGTSVGHRALRDHAQSHHRIEGGVSGDASASSGDSA